MSAPSPGLVSGAAVLAALIVGYVNLYLWYRRTRAAMSPEQRTAEDRERADDLNYWR